MIHSTSLTVSTPACSNRVANRYSGESVGAIADRCFGEVAAGGLSVLSVIVRRDSTKFFISTAGLSHTFLPYAPMLPKPSQRLRLRIERALVHFSNSCALFFPRAVSARSNSSANHVALRRYFFSRPHCKSSRSSRSTGARRPSLVPHLAAWRPHLSTDGAPTFWSRIVFGALHSPAELGPRTHGSRSAFPLSGCYLS